MATQLEAPARFGVRTRRFSAEEVLRMVDAGILDEDEPVELLDGELVVVSPQGPRHSGVTTIVRRRLERAYRGHGAFVREEKPLATEPHSLPEPDLAVVRGNDRDYFDHHPTGQDTLLVVEVAVSSTAIDRRKAAIYARAGIPEYWRLDVNRRRIAVHTGPRPDGRYRTVRTLAEDEELTPPGTSARIKLRNLLP